MSPASFWGVVSVMASFAGLLPYGLSVWQQRTHPHPLSWGSWSLLTALICCLPDQGDAGRWGNICTALLCGLIAMAGWHWRTRIMVRRGDYLLLGLILAVMPLWLFSHQPLLAAMLLTLIDLAAMWPTLRKSWHQPTSENRLYYLSWLVKYPASMAAMPDLTLINSVYPVASCLAAMVMLTVLQCRRHDFLKMEAQSGAKIQG